MALIKCKECGQQMSSSARVCPHCGKQRASASKTGCAWIIVLFGALVIWGIWEGGAGSGDSSVTNIPSATVASSASSATPQPIQSTTAVTDHAPVPWIYSSSTDSMSGRAVHQALVISDNAVEFSFPYTGEQHASLILRKHPRYGTDAIFSIERGQFGCGFDGCTILVRFDDGKAEPYTGTEPEDRSTTVVFIAPASRFIAHLHKAKVLRIESTFFQQGSQVFTFDVSGLDDKKFTGG